MRLRGTNRQTCGSQLGSGFRRSQRRLPRSSPPTPGGFSTPLLRWQRIELPAQRAELPQLPTYPQSSRQSSFVVQNFSVVRRPEGFTEVRRAILPDAYKAISESFSPHILHSLQTLAN